MLGIRTGVWDHLRFDVVSTKIEAIADNEIVGLRASEVPN